MGFMGDGRKVIEIYGRWENRNENLQRETYKKSETSQGR